MEDFKIFFYREVTTDKILCILPFKHVPLSGGQEEIFGTRH